MNWQIGRLVSSKMVAANLKSLSFALSDWKDFLPGQHYDIRLTAPDGYQAERSYSLASSPNQKGIIEFGVEILPDGEVSPYLFQMEIGEEVELKGPIGGHFIWMKEMPGDLLFLAGGSGLIPFMSMIRYALEKEVLKEKKIYLLASARSEKRFPYLSELESYGAQNENFLFYPALTRESLPNWWGLRERFNQEILDELVGELDKANINVYVCGNNSFVETMASHLVSLGYPAARIKTERFGGSV